MSHLVSADEPWFCDRFHFKQTKYKQNIHVYVETVALFQDPEWPSLLREQGKPPETHAPVVASDKTHCPLVGRHENTVHVNNARLRKVFIRRRNFSKAKMKKNRYRKMFYKL